MIGMLSQGLAVIKHEQEYMEVRERIHRMSKQPAAILVLPGDTEPEGLCKYSNSTRVSMSGETWLNPLIRTLIKRTVVAGPNNTGR